MPSAKAAPHKHSHRVQAREDSEEPANHLPYQEWPFPCTRADCEHRFMTLKEMQRHKIKDPDHFYCKRCDVDCLDWQDLTRHKVQMMEPWITGEKHIKHEEPKHIVCEFCGEDFKSFGGRKRHRAIAHPADQDIQCPGCSVTFLRASSMVEHLELGKCPKISQEHFESRVQQKYIVGEVMEDPQAFLAKLAQNNRKGSRSKHVSLYDEDSDPEAETESDYSSEDEAMGGVKLIDLDDDDKKSKSSATTRSRVPTRTAVGEAWPALPVKIKAEQDQTCPGPSHSTDSDQVSKAVKKIEQNPYPPLPGNEAARDSVKGKAEETALAKQPTAWTPATNARAMLPYQRKPPAPGDWSAIVAHAKSQGDQNGSTNLLKSHWWDPTSTDYRVDRFWNELTQTYHCPFPACTLPYDAAGDLERHLLSAHRKTKWTCPACLKIYKFKHNLVSHSEESWSCRVRQSAAYPKLLDELSGGYLQAENLGEVKIYNTSRSTALVKADTLISNGVMHTRYMAKLPTDQ